MTLDKKLGSPIMLPPHRRTILPSFPAPPRNPIRQSFVKVGSLYAQPDRFFVGIGPTLSGISAIEFAEGVPVSFISHCTIENTTEGERVVQPSHKNVLDLKEVFIMNKDMFFLYAKWGVTLNEVQELSPAFKLGEVEVAVICKGVLNHPTDIFTRRS